MCDYALFFLDNPTAPQAATTATAPNNTTIELSPVLGDVVEADDVLLSTTNATGDRELNVALIVPLPASDFTTSHAFLVVS